jgi:transcription elongation factor GreA
MKTTKKEYFLTTDGVAKLKEELAELTGPKRAQIAARLKEAKEYGDLSENIQWDDAKDQQAFIEGRIAEIEMILKHSVIIEAKTGSTVGLGSTVHVELEDGQQRYTIVGSTEANPDEGKISNESPIGKALLGKKPGEEVEVVVPSGTMLYKITHVE